MDTQKWDLEHYLKVLKARRAQGLASPEKPLLVSHPLFNKTIRHKPTGAQFLIESVRQGWWKGPYLHIVARQLPGASHTVLMTGAERCFDDSIREQAAKFDSEFELMPD